MRILDTGRGWPHVLLPSGGDVPERPPSLAEAEKQGAWSAWRAAVAAADPEAVITAVTASGLRGRGGAGFPTGQKWQTCRASDDPRRHVVANGFEADPAAQVDRLLMERAPHAVVEGTALAAFAVGAAEALIVVKDGYRDAIAGLEAVVRAAEEEGLLGQNVLGSGLDLHVSVRPMGGSFVLGEETVLLRSLEGRRAQPDQRPPYPSERGLWGQPTVVNNVETLAAVPWILRRGASGYAEIGAKQTPGSTLVQLSGAVRRTGVAEIPLGARLADVVERAGGGSAGRLKAVLVGGPSGGFIPAEGLDTRLAYEALESAGAMMGSGTILAVDDSACIVDLATLMTRVVADEACGKTIPCRIGTRRLAEIGERMTSGRPRPNDPQSIQDLAADVRDAALCALESTAIQPLLSGMRYFGQEFEDHIVRGDCPAGVCRPIRVAPSASQRATPSRSA
jgi:NADP-reducing hydrogenase subunit HndC